MHIGTKRALIVGLFGLAMGALGLGWQVFGCGGVKHRNASVSLHGSIAAGGATVAHVPGRTSGLRSAYDDRAPHDATAANSDGAGRAGTNQAGQAARACRDCQFDCCNDSCTNTGNDANNCGGCGKRCPDGARFCNFGKCVVPPCQTSTCATEQVCCGTECCDIGKICCRVPMPSMDVLGCVTPDARGTCPTGCALCGCAAPDTPIATPLGERAISTIRAGDLVYSMHAGALIAVPVRAVRREPAIEHIVRRVELADGRALELSAAHPTSDGRTIAEIGVGDRLGDALVTRLGYVAYVHEFTYDLLPDSAEGTYFAAGALIGSTLARPGPNAAE